MHGNAMRIRVDDLRHGAVVALLRAHVADLARHSPPESCHALDVAALRRPEVTFWTAWDGAALMGCGALQALDARHGEVKSMRTAPGYLRRGVAAALLETIVAQARSRGMRRLSLETGVSAAFAPAHALYRRHGFAACAPFGAYVDDPHSVFMARDL